MLLNAWRKSFQSCWFSRRRGSIHDRRRKFGAEASRLSPIQHAELLEVRTLLCGSVDDAWVVTNRHDYAPGDNAVITGGHFQVGETIQLQVLHTDGTTNTGGGHDSWYVTDGGIGDLDRIANGQFQTTWYVNPDDSAGSAFELKATGSQSGLTADTTFTDSGIGIGSVTTKLGAAASGDVTSTTISHTVSAASDRLLLVSVITEGNENASGMTYNGVALTRAIRRDGGGANETSVEIWYLVAPDVGTFDLVVTFSGTSPFGVTATNLTGVNQFTPIGTTVGANAASGSPSINLTTTTYNSLIFGAVAKDNETTTFTPGANVGELWDTTSGSGSEDLALWGGTRSTITPGQYTLNATASVATDDWTMAAIEIQAAVYNPPLPSNACDLDIVLTMDISNSIDDTELVAMKSALTAFVNAFDSHENTKFALVTFNSVGTLVDITPGVTFTDDGAAVNDAINRQTTRGGVASGTDWTDGLFLARQVLAASGRIQFPDLIVFASDGNPTTPLNEAINEASAARLDGMRILAVGIGDQVNADNMKAISGPNEAPPFTKDTDFIPSTFDTLPQDLASLADALCPNIQVIEKVNGDDANTAPGVTLATAGQTLTYTFEVTTTSSSGLSNIAVTDSDIGSPNPVLQSDNIHNIGDLDDDNRLDVGETWQYSATAVAKTGQRTSVATVTGISPTNAEASDTDPISYFDPTPNAVTVKDVTVVEGVGLVFTVTLNNLVPGGTKVNVTLSNVTATGGAALVTPVDYNNVVAALNFAGISDETKQFTVATLNDAVVESSETFTVKLDAVNPLVNDTDTATGTITDNDTAAVTVEDVTAVEGIGLVFTVMLNNAVQGGTLVNVTLADATATAGVDYRNVVTSLNFSGTVGETKQFTVATLPDAALESFETFTVNLDAVNPLVTDTDTATGTITENTLSVSDVSLIEGTGTTVNAVFTVSLSQPSTLPVSVDYTTANGTALKDFDYLYKYGKLLFGPGQTSKTVVIPIKSDKIDELDEEFFFLNLTAANNATIVDGQGQCTITDDDAAPTLSIKNLTVKEGTGSAVKANFKVSLSAASGLPVTVNYATEDNSATAPADYTSVSGSLSFVPGQTTKTITVLIAGDALHELNETFFLNLTSPTNATLAVNQAVGTITDNDATPKLSINNPTITEGNNGTVDLVFTVTLSAASGLPVTVNYATIDGTANATDYNSTSGSLTFNAGETTKTITVSILGDAIAELKKTFSLNLSGALNALFASSKGIGTILDND